MITRGWNASGWVGALSISVLVVATGCSADLGPGGGDAGVADDLGLGASDLAVAADLTAPPDLAPAADILPTFTYADKVKSLTLSRQGWMEEPLPGVKVCLYPNESGPLCTTSDDKGDFVLPNLPGNVPIAVSAALDGYVPQLVDLVQKDGASPGQIALIDRTTLDGLAQLAGLTLDLDNAGAVVLHVFNERNGEYDGAKAHLMNEVLTGGPYYVKNGLPQLDSTTSADLAIVGWINVKPGDYDATTSDRDDALCQLRTGWPPMDKAKVVGLKVVAGFMTVVTTRC